MFQQHASLKVLAAALFAALPAMAGVQACPASPCTYSGEAVVASATALGINANIADTGSLPNAGGSLSTQVANAGVPGLLTLNLLTASTSGANGRTSSQASVANVTINAVGIVITANVLTSNANAQACFNTPSVNGNSTIVGLTVNGQPITVSGQPNQTLPLLVGSLIINEQTSSVSNSGTGSSAEMVVNALHLKAGALADVVVSSARAGVCGGTGCK